MFAAGMDSKMETTTTGLLGIADGTLWRDPHHNNFLLTPASIESGPKITSSPTIELEENPAAIPKP
jgi:hypothetical protein